MSGTRPAGGQRQISKGESRHVLLRVEAIGPNPCRGRLEEPPPEPVDAAPSSVPGIDGPIRFYEHELGGEFGAPDRKIESSAVGARQHIVAGNSHVDHPSVHFAGARARTEDGQLVVVLTGCRILNRMLELGKPESIAVGA